MKKAMIFGAGISGNGAEETLKKMGYKTILVDDKIALSSAEAIEVLNNESIELFIKSPGVPYTELVLLAKNKNIEILDDIELGYRYKILNNIKGKIIAITGTNGKTTITTKIKELLEFSGCSAKVCGNIGYSFSETVSKNKDLDFFVLEASSYQLENIKKFKADIALITNLTPDHLARYSSLDEYYNVKFNIGKNQNEKDYFLVNTNNIEILNREYKITAQKVELGINKEKNDQVLWCDNKFVYYNNEAILDQNLLSLKGKHNLENILFIVCVGKLLGISTEIIKEFLYNTKSLEHRMEDFYKYGKNTFINDSKGTNIDSTKFAVEAFKNPILICGGYDKKLDLAPLVNLIKDNVKEVYLIGEISDILEEKLNEKNYALEKIYNLKNLEDTLIFLKSKLREDEENIILFSPATSSFDQFKNFEERGEIFKALVKKYFS